VSHRKEVSVSDGHTARWKTQLYGAKEHRLEAYATLFSGLSSDLSAPSREVSPCNPEQRRDGVD
jgi:hypothetical protein